MPAHSLSAPARATLIAAARLMPGVWGVLGSSVGVNDAHAVVPPVHQRGLSIRWSSGSVLASARRARPMTSRWISLVPSKIV